MEKNKVDMFLMSNARYFSPEQIMYVKDELEKMDDSKFVFLQTAHFRDNTVALILGIVFGADRIYLNELALGILKIFLICMVIGMVWWFIDLFSISRRVKEYNMWEFKKLTMYY